MKRHERLNTLLDILGEKGGLEVEEAAAALGVSAATTRRDLDALAEQQLLIRTRGGAVPGHVNYDLPVRYRQGARAEGRAAVARAAAGMVPSGSVVGLSGGTTTTEIARALARRPEFGETATEPNLTVVTNALNIANELAIRPQIKTVVTGGVAHARSFELSGTFAETVLGRLHLDIAFIGVNGISPTEGATVHSEEEASVNALMARRAQRAFVVADASKIGTRCFARIGGGELFDGFLTDSSSASEAVAEFDRSSLAVTVCGAENEADA